MKTYLRMVTVLAIVTMLFGCSKLTVENYRKLKVGLGYGEVVKILGKPDSCSEAMIAKNCVWGNEQKNITVNFMGDKVLFFTSRNIR